MAHSRLRNYFYNEEDGQKDKLVVQVISCAFLNLAEELGNVSKACKVMSVSHYTFYRYQELVEDGGIDALINKSRRTANLKNRVDEATEQTVIAYAVDLLVHG